MVKNNTNVTPTASMPVNLSGESCIVSINGKQELVYVGSRIKCQKIESDCGTELAFNDVLTYIHPGGVEYGAPFLTRTVKAKVVKHARDKKVIIFKKIRRHGYQRKRGHRQHYTELEIVSV